MKIKFLEKCELSVVEDFNEATEESSVVNQIFNIDDEHDVDLSENDDDNSADIQFGDGSVTFSVPNHLFQKLE
jgi:hypothetical protein